MAQMKLIDDLHWRYATKKFNSEKVVPEETVSRLLEATNLAATSYGLQPFKFIVIRDQELQERLVTSSYGQAQVAQASHVIVIATRTDVDASYISSYVDFMESERGLDPGALDKFKMVMTGAIGGMTEAERLNWAEKQAYIALGVLLTACGIEKVDACPMEGFISSEYDDILQLSDQNLCSCVVIPIGYRADDDKYSSLKKIRRPLNEMLIEMRKSE